MVRISNCIGKNASIVNGPPQTSGMIYNKFYIDTDTLPLDITAKILSNIMNVFPNSLEPYSHEDLTV